MICIGIETKIRPVENYLDQTLTNLERAGVPRSEHFAGLTITHGEGCTRLQNAQRTILAAVEQAEIVGAEWVMKLEDDLDFTDNFLENVTDWLADCGHAAAPMFVFGATFERVSQSHFNEDEHSIFDQVGKRISFPNARAYMRRDINVVGHSVRGFWAAQCLVWKTETARHLAEWMGDDPTLFDGKMYHRDRGHDLQLQVWGAELGAKVFATCVPSFVQHIGRHSNLSRPGEAHVQPFFEFPFAGHHYRYRRKNA